MSYHLNLAYDPSISTNRGPNDFYCILPEPLFLNDGEYEVGLTYLMVKTNWSEKNYITHITIHSDIISDTVYKNNFEKILLLVKPYSKYVNDYFDKSYDKPKYLKVNKTYINRVNFQIKYKTDILVPFLDRNTPIIINLHIRKIKK